MRALRLNGRVLRLDENVTMPPLRVGDVRLRVRYAGICRTDRELVRGYMGFEGTLGHEFVGLVEEGSDVFPAGSFAVSEINCACGSCEWCRAGRREHCPSRTVIGIDGRAGAFADCIDVPEQNLHAVPAGIPEPVSALVEPMAAALKGVEDAELEPGHRIAVLGDGTLGLLTALAIARSGRMPLLLGRHPEKLAAVEGAGVEVRLSEAGSAPCPPSSFDRVIDCTGRAEGLTEALRLVRPRGVIVLKTTIAEPHRIDLAPLVIDEARIVGSRCGDFGRAIEFLREGADDIARLISGVYPLGAWREAFEHAGRPDCIKVLMRVGAPGS